MESRYSKFTLLISNINKAINHIKTNEMQKFGLKCSHVSCLYYLSKKPDGVTASELCSLCDEDKGAISRSLDYLEKENYIKYNDNEIKKKYRAKIVLTAKGKSISDEIVNITDNAVDIGSFGINEQEKEIMYKCLESISENLNKYRDK